MVGVEVHIRLKKEKRHEFLQAVQFCTLKCKNISECRDQMLYEHVFEEGRFLWVEYWGTREALESHLASDSFRALLGAADVLGQMETGWLAEFKQMPDKMVKIT